jgi:hypothetical protein
LKAMLAITRGPWAAITINRDSCASRSLCNKPNDGFAVAPCGTVIRRETRLSRRSDGFLPWIENS